MAPRQLDDLILHAEIVEGNAQTAKSELLQGGQQAQRVLPAMPDEEINSPEYLGKPCQETASAPTIRKSTLFECKHSINALESFGNAIAETPLLNREKDFHSLFGCHGVPHASVRFVSFFEALEYADDLLH